MQICIVSEYFYKVPEVPIYCTAGSNIHLPLKIHRTY